MKGISQKLDNQLTNRRLRSSRESENLMEQKQGSKKVKIDRSFRIHNHNKDNKFFIQIIALQSQLEDRNEFTGLYAKRQRLTEQEQAEFKYLKQILFLGSEQNDNNNFLDKNMEIILKISQQIKQLQNLMDFYKRKSQGNFQKLQVTIQNLQKYPHYVKTTMTQFLEQYNTTDYLFKFLKEQNEQQKKRVAKVYAQKNKSSLEDAQKILQDFDEDYIKDIMELVKDGFLIQMSPENTRLIADLLTYSYSQKINDLQKRINLNTNLKGSFGYKHQDYYCPALIKESQFMKDPDAQQAAKEVLEFIASSGPIHEAIKQYLTIYGELHQKPQIMKSLQDHQAINTIKQTIKSQIQTIKYIDYRLEYVQGVTCKRDQILQIFINTFYFSSRINVTKLFQSYLLYVFLHEIMHVLLRVFGFITHLEGQSITEDKMELWLEKSKQSLQEELAKRISQIKIQKQKFSDLGSNFQIYIFGLVVEQAFEEDFEEYKNNTPTVKNFRTFAIDRELKKFNQQITSKKKVKLRSSMDQSPTRVPHFRFADNWCITSYKHTRNRNRQRQRQQQNI